MKFKKTFISITALAVMFLLVAPHVTNAASGRGLFKDVYCAVLALVNKECETEIDGIQIKQRADLDQGTLMRLQANASDIF